MLIPIIIGAVAYNGALQVVERDAREANLSMLEQCVAILDRRFEEVECIATQLALNPKLWDFARELSPYIDRTIPYKINEIRDEIAPITTTNNFIKMLCIYFNKSDVTIFTTHSWIKLDYFYGKTFQYGDMDTSEWRDKILNRCFHKEYFPINSVILKDQNDPSRFISESMFMFIQSFPSIYSTKGQIMVFIPKKKIEELFRPIITQQGGYVYILDSKGRKLADFSSSEKAVEAFDFTFHDSNGFFVHSSNEEDMIVTYKTSLYNGWKYIAVMPYNIVMQRVFNIRIRIIIMLLISLLLGLLGAYIMAYRNSKPIRSIIDIVRGMMSDNENDIETEENEYAYLRGSIIHLVTTNRDLRQNLGKILPLLEAIFFDKLLNGQLTSVKDFQWFLKQLNIKWFDEKIAVVIAQIEHSDQDLSEQELFKISENKINLKEIMEKILVGPVYSYDLDYDKMAMLIGVQKHKEIDEKVYVENVLERIWNELKNNYNITVFFTVGSIAEDYLEISQSFSEAKEALTYKNLYTDKYIIWYYDMPSEKGIYYYPISLETRLINYARLGNIVEIERIIKRLYKENFIKRSMSGAMIMYFMYEIRGTVLKILDMFPSEHGDDVSKIENKINSIDVYMSVDKVFDILLCVYKDICNLVERNKEQRKHNVIEDIVKYINANYLDSQLDLVKVADRFGFAPAYLSQLFKESTGENFSTYLERVRIKKASELLSMGKSVSDVAQEVGYNSVHVFRKAFKRVQGVTPSDYKTKTHSDESVLEV